MAILMTARGDSERAWEELYRSHGRSVLAAATLAAGGNRHEAWDGVQHAFTEAWIRLMKPDSLTVDNWPGWLRQVAVRHVVRHRQHQNRTESLEGLDCPQAMPPLDTQLVLKEEYQDTLKVVAQMHPRRRQALALHLIAGYSTAETARIMEVEESSVRSLVRLARGSFPNRKQEGGADHG
ncbi:RNA polymerase sigma factor [Streptomyces sp. NBC_01615]|uniref:RNA polymerase sigma factor n=1 Tax=Streptomyces sp. NBC_01615 TaxID=2975898 RepID=UPI003866B251